MSTRILLIRHGQTYANLNHVIAGRYEAELTDLGREQAQITDIALKNASIDVLYSSGLKRANDTISYLAREKGVDFLVDGGFLELDYGIYDGKSLSEYSNEKGEITNTDIINYYLNDSPDFTFAGGERLQDGIDRYLSAIKRVAEKHNGKTIAVATHSDILNWVLPYLIYGNTKGKIKRRDKSVRNCSISVVQVDGEEIKLISSDDISHIPNHLRSR